MEATIVIPTHNRRATLLRTLDALRAGVSDVTEWEAIVVDDGSTDGTAEAVLEWAQRHRVPVRCLSQARSGPAVARNRGAWDARGRVVAFLDDDIQVRPGFLRRHLDVIAAHPGAWVIGRIVHPADLRGTPFGRWRDERWESFHRAHAGGLGETAGMTAAHLAAPRADLARLRGFDETFPAASCEDAELALRARAAGVRILYDPDNVGVHEDWAVSLPRYCERQRSYSVADVLLYRKYADRAPRAALVRHNAPAWPGDGWRERLGKAAKRCLATAPGRAAVRALSAAAERIAPDSRLSRRAYEVAVGLAIFRGVREGLARYPATHARVDHLVDFNRDTPYFRAIARHHDRGRWPVRIGSLEDEGELQRAMRALDVPTFGLRARVGWGALPSAWRLARLLRRGQVGVLHAHCFYPTLTGLLAARMAGVPFVFTRHHSDHHLRLGKRWHTRLDSWCARRAAHVIAVSEATRRILVDTERGPPCRVSVVWNGMESLDEPSADEVLSLRASLGLAAEAAICVTPARLHEEKGHLVLLRAAAEAVRDVHALIALASVVVLPSLAESFGFAALEAMSLGRPVVASRAGGLPEVVSDGETGLLVDVGDAPALARALVALLRDPGRAAALGAAGRERARTFSCERMLRGYEAVYGRIAR
jgi:starch synthase